MNTVNLEAVAEVNKQLGAVMMKRNGSSGEPTQLLLDAVNLGVVAEVSEGPDEKTGRLDFHVEFPTLGGERAEGQA